MEGISHEACSLAGHLGLGKLIVLYDDNGITIDGPASLSFSENVPARFAAYGWHVQQIDGHDVIAIDTAIQTAIESPKPTLIACKTRIGAGSPNRENTSKAHGEPLGSDEVRLVKQRLGWPVDEEFFIPREAREHLVARTRAGATKFAAWLNTFARYQASYPELARELTAAMRGELPEGWQDALPDLTASPPIATRAASGNVINALAPIIPALVGGSADLTPSNNTQPKGHGGRPVTHANFDGYYLHFGVREHGMGAILNGLALHGGLRPYGGTFLVFSDYMRSPIRMAALMQLPTIFVFTHDSIGLGEDGPTHQPVEHLTSLRAIPNLVVLRPADAAETVESWRIALERTTGPTALILTRQALPVLDRTRFGSVDDVKRGAYVVAGSAVDEAIIIATGSELHIALEAQALLQLDGVGARVVSMPSREIFEQQDRAYRDRVLLPELRARVAVEAGSTLGWGGYVGLEGEVVGLDHFGASAPGPDVYRDVGLTAEAVAGAVRRTLTRTRTRLHTAANNPMND
jgi:transketolase